MWQGCQVKKKLKCQTQAIISSLKIAKSLKMTKGQLKAEILKIS